MLHYGMELLTTAGQFQLFSWPELPSFGFFWQDITGNMQRALQNIYELDDVGQRKLVFSVALYVVFTCVVLKVLSPKKKKLFFRKI